MVQSINEEMKQLFQPIVDDLQAEIKSWSKAEQDARHGWRWEVQNSQNKKIQMMQEMDVTFTASDANNDELLNMEEYEDFLTRMKANAEAKGLKAVPVTEKRVEMTYVALNSITPETDGISIRDYLTGFAI